MSNSIAPGSSVDVNVRVTALTTNPNVPVTYKTIILKKNLVNGVNTLTQEMISTTNTKYVIKYDFTLGENITVPDNCILEFDGGSILANSSNDTIIGNNTGINAGLVKIFNIDVTLTGTWKLIEVYPEWFGAIADYNISSNIGTDASLAINKAINVAETIAVPKIKFVGGYYLVTSSIQITKGNICLEGVYGISSEGYGPHVLMKLPGIYTNTGISVISISSLLQTHSFTIKNLNISNNYLTTHVYNAIGINIKCGLHWPINIENCHFQGFDKAISVDGNGNNYALAWLHISYCGFIANNVCVYTEDKNTSYDAPYCSKQYINGFYFEHNRCHGNCCVIDVGVAWDGAYIFDNNVEGQNTTEIDDVTESPYNYIINIHSAYRANTKIEKIYSEGNTKKLLYIKGEWTPNQIEIKNITVVGNTNGGICYLTENIYLKEYDNSYNTTIITEDINGNGFTDKQDSVLDILCQYNLKAGTTLTIPQNTDIILHSSTFIKGNVIMAGNNMILPYYISLYDTGKAINYNGGAPAVGCQDIRNGKLCFYNGTAWVDATGATV